MGAELAGQVAVNATNAAINTGLNYWLGSEARRQNYEYGELAAMHADQRTRALYNDLQSPEALLRQYKEAGLSPSLMFGGSGAGGTTPAQGAQGTGAAGIAPAYGQMDAMNVAQIGLMQAEANKAQAEADRLNSKSQLGQAELAKLLQDTKTSLANEGYYSAAAQVQNTEKELKDLELTLKETTFNTDVATKEADLQKIRIQIEKNNEELRSLRKQADFDEEMYETKCKELRYRVRNLAKDLVEKNSEINLNKAQRNYFIRMAEKVEYETQLDYYYAQLKGQEFKLESIKASVDTKYKAEMIKLGYNEQQIQIVGQKLDLFDTMINATISSISLGCNKPKTKKK